MGWGGVMVVAAVVVQWAEVGGWGWGGADGSSNECEWYSLVASGMFWPPITQMKPSCTAVSWQVRPPSGAPQGASSQTHVQVIPFGELHTSCW